MTPTDYPTRLKMILETEGRSQAWLAKKVGCTRQMVGLWVGGKRPIGAEWRTLIARALGRSETDVFPDTVHAESEAA